MSELSDYALQAIQKGEHGHHFKIGEIDFTTKPVHIPPADPLVATIVVSTLQGLVDYLTADIDLHEENEIAIHVVSPTLVQLIKKIERRDNKRSIYIEAKYASPFDKEFRFDEYYERQDLHIALQTLFVPDSNRDLLLGLLGNMREQKVREFSDDGISQEIVTRKGRAGVGDVEVPNPVSLAPLRTFPEVEQPTSPFILRVESSDAESVPQCALFEADGGAWALEAIKGIRDWFDKALGDADLSIPIIA